MCLILDKDCDQDLTRKKAFFQLCFSSCYDYRMRKMGIDFGSKKVGIALSDDAGLMAFPHAVYPNDAQLLTTIESLIEGKGVREVVVGLSLGRDGEPNKIHKVVEEFIADLTLRTPVPIHLEPEQYTTQEAIRFQGRNKDTDASAAAIILNSYITRTKK